MSAPRAIDRQRSRLDDETSRARKAAKILAILHRELGPDLSSYSCVDVGCSSGLLTANLAPHLGPTLGIEYDAQAVHDAATRRNETLAFVRADGERLPVADASVGLVICAQVYEHVADAAGLFAEIWRVLTPGGVCFFSGPNRLYPVELHYRLPFIHWLPFGWSQALLPRLLPHTVYDVRPMTGRALRRHLKSFQIIDYSEELLRRPKDYACEDEVGPLAFVGHLPAPLLHGILPLVPNFNWLLLKCSKQA